MKNSHEDQPEHTEKCITKTNHFCIITLCVHIALFLKSGKKYNSNFPGYDGENSKIND